MVTLCESAQNVNNEAFLWKTAVLGREKPPELVVLVDFKAIYPGVPPGIFASFPGVAHFVSFVQICQSRKSTGYPVQ